MNNIEIIEQYMDVFQISYDEPNADENFSVIKDIFPKVKRVKNIKGFDESHSYAAHMSDKDYILILDGDLRITQDIFDDFSEYIFLKGRPEKILNDKGVTSWCSKNIVNGLIYGNGGPKIWKTEVLKRVKSHSSGKLDWIGEISYRQMNNWYGYSVINATPYQAWRSGFRECLKFCFDNNSCKKLKNPKKEMQHENYIRMIFWMNLGRDVSNGIFSILGARSGAWELLVDHVSHDIILDYDILKNYYRERYEFLENNQEELEKYVHSLGVKLRKYFDFDIYEFNSLESEWIKKFIHNHKRSDISLEKIPLEETLIKDNFKNKT
ncbi:MAG: hypothetical protein NZZ41_00135 [Candidatus Dojkabacteria bacterium]|nr:hypothetical protein [Candidatus Dojkabacteria bacterium]